MSKFLIVLLLMISETVYAQRVTYCRNPTEVNSLMPMDELAERISSLLLWYKVNHWVEESESSKCDVDLTCRPLAERYFYIFPYRHCVDASGCRLEVMDRPVPMIETYFAEDLLNLYLLIDYTTCKCSILSVQPVFYPWFHAIAPELFTTEYRAKQRFD